MIIQNLNDFKQTNTLPLHVRSIIKQMACDLFKIIDKFSPEYINDLVKIKSPSKYFRAERRAEVPRVFTIRYGLRSFRAGASQVLNSLPNKWWVADSYLPVLKADS